MQYYRPGVDGRLRIGTLLGGHRHLVAGHDLTLFAQAADHVEPGTSGLPHEQHLYRTRARVARVIVEDHLVARAGSRHKASARSRVEGGGCSDYHWLFSGRRLRTSPRVFPAPIDTTALDVVFRLKYERIARSSSVPSRYRAATANVGVPMASGSACGPVTITSPSMAPDPPGLWMR